MFTILQFILYPLSNVLLQGTIEKMVIYHMFIFLVVVVVIVYTLDVVGFLH